MPATAPHCLCPNGQRLIVLRELEKASIIVELYPGLGWVLLFLVSQSQSVSFNHGCWPSTKERLDCKTQEQGHTEAAGSISPFSHFFSQPRVSHPGWRSPDGTPQLSLSLIPDQVLHTRPRKHFFSYIPFFSLSFFSPLLLSPLFSLPDPTIYWIFLILDMYILDRIIATP